MRRSFYAAAALLAACGGSSGSDRAGHATLGLSLIGRGSGTVTVRETGASCTAARCEVDLPAGTAVHLIATEDANSRFLGWGGNCSGLAECALVLDRALSVSADFDLLAALRLEVSGSGEVTATGQLTGTTLRCRGAENAAPAKCAGEFAAREQVLLRPAADPDFEFLSWSGGACTGVHGDCAIDLDARTPASVAAGFRRALFNGEVTVQRIGRGSGTVRSTPPGIDCGQTCKAVFRWPASTYAPVALEAIPDPGSRFAGWSGDCFAEGGRGRCGLGGGTAVAVFERVSAAAPARRYDVRRITDTGFTTLTVLSINSSGQATARIDVPGGDRPPYAYGVLWDGSAFENVTPETHETNLASWTSRRQGSATSINAAGTIAGYFGVRVLTPFVQDGHGTVTELGSLGPGLSAWANSINAQGQVAGAAALTADRSVMHAARFYPGGIVDLGTLGGGRSEASFIADSGAILGWSALADGRIHPFVFRDGSMADLEPAARVDGRAIGLDRAARILGIHRDRDSGAESSFLIEDGAVRDLGVPGASAINGGGRIVGTLARDSMTFGYVLDQEVVVELDDAITDPSCRVLSATAINDAGWIGASVSCPLPDHWRPVGQVLDGAILIPVEAP